MKARAAPAGQGLEMSNARPVAETAARRAPVRVLCGGGRRRCGGVRARGAAVGVGGGGAGASQALPLAGGDAPEGFDHARVELRARATLQLGARGVVAAARAVDAVADHRVEGVGDGEDARAEVDLFTLEPERVA